MTEIKLVTKQECGAILSS